MIYCLFTVRGDKRPDLIKDNYRQPCACGCGSLIWHFNYEHKTIHYVKGHNRRKDYAKTTTKQGYIRVKIRSYRNNYVPEHRLIWEKHHKACLLSWSDVHHLDGNKKNNDIKNLEAMTHVRHTILHHTGMKYKIKK